MKGIDASSCQGVVDFAALAAAGHRWAYMKCGEGNDPGRKDADFERNLAGARAAGLAAGCYHFPYPLPPAAGSARGTR